MSSIEERFSEAVKLTNLSRSELAEKLGISIGHMMKLSSGHAKITKKLANKFCGCFGYRIEWLLNGEGLRTNQEDTIYKPIKNNSNIEDLNNILSFIYDFISNKENIDSIKVLSKNLNISEKELFCKLISEQYNTKNK